MEYTGVFDIDSTKMYKFSTFLGHLINTIIKSRLHGFIGDWERVSNFDQSEARKLCFLASD